METRSMIRSMNRILWSRLFHRWFPARRAAGPRMASARPRHLRTRPWLEILEDRTLLAPQVFTVSLPGDPVNPDGTPVGFNNQGSLRFCIQQADLPSNAGSTIQFGGAVGSVITLTHGELA